MSQQPSVCTALRALPWLQATVGIMPLLYMVKHIDSGHGPGLLIFVMLVVKNVLQVAVRVGDFARTPPRAITDAVDA